VIEKYQHKKETISSIIVSLRGINQYIQHLKLYTNDIFFSLLQLNAIIIIFFEVA